MDVKKLKLVFGAGILFFVVIPFVLDLFDSWMQDVQNEMIESDIKREAQRVEEVRQRRDALQGEICDSRLRSERCRQPQSVDQLETCLLMLRDERCDERAGFNLCAAVDRIDECWQTENWMLKRDCDKLRHAAACAERPASDGGNPMPDHIWEIDTSKYDRQGTAGTPFTGVRRALGESGTPRPWSPTEPPSLEEFLPSDTGS